MGRGRPTQPDATKRCERCGDEFTRLGLRLDWAAWNNRRFCSAYCHRPPVDTEPLRPLSKLELQCYWTELWTRDEIHEVAASLDFLTKEAA